MNRRSFLKILAVLPFFATPLARLKADEYTLFSAGDFDVRDLTPLQLEHLRKINEFELQLQKLNGQFSWFLHNELRHYYGALSEARSLFHADVILAHSVMDSYILNTLSDWHFTLSQPNLYNPAQAIRGLQCRTDTHPELSYLGAACFLRAGEISQAIGQFNRARSFYQRAFSMGRHAESQASWVMGAYQSMAQTKLSALNTGYFV